jgi:hypothetical protein
MAAENRGGIVYAIARDWLEFRRWLCEDPQGRKDVDYFTPARAKALVRRGAPEGTLLRLPGWESSPARQAAERLEACRGRVRGRPEH